MNPYIAQVVQILGPLYNNGRIENVTWTSVAEAKQVKMILQQKKAQIKLVKQQVAAAKQQIHAAHSNQRAHIGKSAGAGLATGLFGAKTVGKMNSLNRAGNRQQELHQLAPYEEANRFIANVTTALDQIKTQIDIWLTTNK